MRQSSSVTLTKKLIVSVAAVFLWMILVTGVFSVFTGSKLIGAFWLGLALVLVVVLLQGKLIAKLDGRELPFYSIALILLILLLIGITEVMNLFMTEPRATASYVFDVAYSLGIVILGGYSGYLLLRAPRSQSQASEDPDPRS